MLKNKFPEQIAINRTVEDGVVYYSADETPGDLLAALDSDEDVVATYKLIGTKKYRRVVMEVPET